MPLVSQAAFARMAGVTRPAIGAAVKSGRLRRDDDKKIDTDDPFSKEYIANTTRQKSQGKRRIAGEYSDDGIDLDALDDSVELGELSKQSLEKMKLREVILLAQIKREHLRGELMSKETVREAFMKFYAVLTGELHPLGDKNAQNLAAAYGVDDAKASATAREIIDKDVFKALAHMKRLMTDFIDLKMDADDKK